MCLNCCKLFYICVWFLHKKLVIYIYIYKHDDRVPKFNLKYLKYPQTELYNYILTLMTLD